MSEQQDLSSMLSEAGKADVFKTLAMNFAALSEAEQARIEPDPRKRELILASVGKGPRAPRVKGDPNQGTIDKLDAVLDAYAELEQRMEELHIERLHLVRNWQFKCKGCNEYDNLSKFTRLQTYSVDADSDYNYHGFGYDMLTCPTCKQNTYIHNSSQRDELLSIAKHLENRIFIATEDRKSGSDSRWF